MHKDTQSSDTETPTLALLSGKEWLAPLLSLHEQVRGQMPRTKKGQLLARPASYFESLLAGETGLVLAGLSGGSPVAMVALVLPGTLQDACEKKVLTLPCTNKRLASKLGDGKVGVVQSLCALQGERARRFPSELLAQLTGYARAQNISHLFAQVGQANVPSWMRFLRAGYEIETGWKPRDEHARFLLHYPAQRQGGDEESIHEYVVPKKSISGKPLLSLFNYHLGEGRRVSLVDAPTKPKHYHFLFG